MHLKGMIDQAPTEVEWELVTSWTTLQDSIILGSLFIYKFLLFDGQILHICFLYRIVCTTIIILFK